MLLFMRCEIKVNAPLQLSDCNGRLPAERLAIILKQIEVEVKRFLVLFS